MFFHSKNTPNPILPDVTKSLTLPVSLKIVLLRKKILHFRVSNEKLFNFAT